MRTLLLLARPAASRGGRAVAAWGVRRGMRHGLQRFGGHALAGLAGSTVVTVLALGVVELGWVGWSWSRGRLDGRGVRVEVATIGGLVLGAGLGMSIGAFLGSIVPVLGTLVGSMIGGGLGGVAGRVLGRGVGWSLFGR